MAETERANDGRDAYHNNKEGTHGDKVHEASNQISSDYHSAFLDLSERTSKFSSYLYRNLDNYMQLPLPERAIVNLKIARTLFSKWTIEVLTVIYNMGSPRFNEIMGILKEASPKVLSSRLKALEELGLIKREVISLRPPAVRYSMTEDGLIVARLGEPVFLFFGIVKGMYSKR
ncbi:MAG: helix-turn-helix domain-containing protein [Nitrososphaerota archaeon]